MAKSGAPRHSKPAQNPVTINLDPSDVKRIDERADAPAREKRAVPPAEPVGDFPPRKAEAEKPAAEAPKPAKPKPAPEAAPFTAGVKPEAERPQRSAPLAAPAASAARGGTHFLAGVAGGVIALGGLLALQWGNVVPSPGGRVSAAELSRIEQQIAEMRAAPTPAPLDEASKAQFAALQKNVQAAEIKAEAVAGTLSDLQKQVGSAPAGGDAVQALTGRVEALEGKLDAAQNQASQAAAGVSDTHGAISSLETQLGSLQQKVTDAARQPDAAVLIAANALKTAIDRGGSYKTELNTFASVAPKDVSFDGLKPFADKGVPTVAELNGWFGAVADRIVATENKLPADAGVWDQLVASAKGLVSVRPVAGNVSGTGVGPTTARMEAALQAGDLERALSEWEQLPADAKAVSQEFADQMKARRDADQMIQRLVADSLKPKAPAAGEAPQPGAKTGE